MILDAVVWQAAFRGAIALAGLGDYASVCIGGFIGAAGVVASMSLSRRELLSRAGWAGLLGAVSALSVYGSGQIPERVPHHPTFRC